MAYCFTEKLCVIADHQPLVAIIIKDLATLSQHLQCVMLCIHQYVQACSRPVHGRLIIQKQPYRKQGPGNDWHEHKHVCHQHISEYTNMHIHRRHTGTNLTGCRSLKANILCNTGLATQSGTRNAEVLANQAQANNDQWHCHERQKNNYSFYIAGANTTAIAQEPYRH